jgi:hypothetical protein
MDYKAAISDIMDELGEFRKDLKKRLRTAHDETPCSHVYLGPNTVRLTFTPIYKYPMLMSLKMLCKDRKTVITESYDGIWHFHIYMMGPHREMVECKPTRHQLRAVG